MSIGEFCNRIVVIAERDTTVLEAALLMRRHHVGSIVVSEARDGVRKPVGIVTDRDIVIEVVCNALDPKTLRLGEIMTGNLAAVREQDGVFETLQLMRSRGIRRAPVIGAEGELIGIIAADDLIQLLSEAMADLSKLITREQECEASARK